jgi:ABC-2 type transport system permease protein
MDLVGRASAVFARRRVIGTLVQRDLKVRYAGSLLGWAWSVIDPLAMAAVYWFVFTVIFESRRVGEQPYVLFLVAGLLPWQWFSSSLTETSRALTAEAKLIRSTNVPREIWVLRVVLSKGVEFVFSLPVLALFVVIYLVLPNVPHPELNWRLVFLPLAVLMQAVLLTGIGLLLAPITALVSDVARLVRIVLRIGFYLTPVIYSVNVAPRAVRHLLTLNPMTGVLELYRSGLFARELRLEAVAVGAVITLAIFLLGAWTFSRLESAVLKEI